VPRGIPGRSPIDRQSSALHRRVRIFLLVLFGSLFVSTVARTENWPAALPRFGPTFAIADFDGDLRPDLASIQWGSNSSSLTNYWIQLQFSTGGRQSIQVAGPAGGLRIAARDVNQDHVPDLVVSSAWQEKPLAIFLNDGRGVFHKVDPSAFPKAADQFETILDSSPPQLTETLAAPPRPLVGRFSQARCVPDSRGAAGGVPRANSRYILSPFLVSFPGRAPPRPSRG
jgi:hypothetical protein